MKTLTAGQFIRNSSNPVLSEAIIRQLDADWEEICESPMDYADGETAVSGFIYYEETNEVYENFEYHIESELTPIQKTILESEEDSDSRNQKAVWYILFNVMSELYDTLKIEE